MQKNIITMKKLIYAAFILLAVAFTSCSKEAIINRKLDGEWKVTSIAGMALNSDESIYFTFEKDGKAGKGSYTEVFGGQSEIIPFTYTLSDDKLTITVTDDGDVETEVFTVNKYESSKIEMTTSENILFVLEPK